MSNFVKITDITPSTKFELWLERLNNELKQVFENRYDNLEWVPFSYSKGNNYIKIKRDSGVWGFVAMKDIQTKNKSFREGDLLMAAGWNAPAKHARGNIFEGTERYTLYGPVYLK